MKLSGRLLTRLLLMSLVAILLIAGLARFSLSWMSKLSADLPWDFARLSETTMSVTLLMMQSRQNGNGDNGAGPLDRSMQGPIFL
jgi:hypothetical protein